MKKRNPLVYSTEKGRICPACGAAQNQWCCSLDKKNVVTGDGVVRISRQTKGRKGSGVTLITGLPFEGAQLKKCAKELKKKCGSGGTVKEGIVEIQGDHRQKLLEILQKRGLKVKLAGG